MLTKIICGVLMLFGSVEFISGNSDDGFLFIGAGVALFLYAKLKAWAFNKGSEAVEKLVDKSDDA